MTPYNEGQQAYKDGKSVTENPYPCVGPYGYGEWRAGWYRAQRDTRTRDDMPHEDDEAMK